MDGILHIDAPAFPRFHFEWHPGAGKVYVVEAPGGGNVARGVAVAEHVDTHAAAYAAVQTWLRGYRKGRHDENIGTT